MLTGSATGASPHTQTCLPSAARARQDWPACRPKRPAAAPGNRRGPAGPSPAGDPGRLRPRPPSLPRGGAGKSLTGPAQGNGSATHPDRRRRRGAAFPSGPTASSPPARGPGERLPATTGSPAPRAEEGTVAAAGPPPAAARSPSLTSRFVLAEPGATARRVAPRAEAEPAAVSAPESPNGTDSTGATEPPAGSGSGGSAKARPGAGPPRGGERRGGRAAGADPAASLRPGWAVRGPLGLRAGAGQPPPARPEAARRQRCAVQTLRPGGAAEFGKREQNFARGVTGALRGSRAARSVWLSVSQTPPDRAPPPRLPSQAPREVPQLPASGTSQFLRKIH